MTNGQHRIKHNVSLCLRKLTGNSGLFNKGHENIMISWLLKLKPWGANIVCKRPIFVWDFKISSSIIMRTWRNQRQTWSGGTFVLAEILTALSRLLSNIRRSFLFTFFSLARVSASFALMEMILILSFKNSHIFAAMLGV